MNGWMDVLMDQAMKVEVIVIVNVLPKGDPIDINS